MNYQVGQRVLAPQVNKEALKPATITEMPSSRSPKASCWVKFDDYCNPVPRLISDLKPLPGETQFE